MKIIQCIFLNQFEDEVKTLRVTYEDKSQQFVTFNLDDPVVSKIVGEVGGVEQIESNTRKLAKIEEKEAMLYEKFKKHMETSDDLSFLFKNNLDQETLFNLKIWLFELPEVDNNTNLNLKNQLRMSKDLIEIIGIYYIMRQEANQNAC